MFRKAQAELSDTHAFVTSWEPSNISASFDDGFMKENKKRR